jgi:hypothetical protein
MGVVANVDAPGPTCRWTWDRVQPVEPSCLDGALRPAWIGQKRKAAAKMTPPIARFCTRALS